VAAHQPTRAPATDASAAAAALLRQKRAESRIVGGRPPEPPPRPARSHMHSHSAAHVLGRPCARPPMCSAALYSATQSAKKITTNPPLARRSSRLHSAGRPRNPPRWTCRWPWRSRWTGRSSASARSRS
jgi:hypothetical protein